VGNLFELEDLGAQDLKGITGPVRAWVAVRPSSAESRFEAFHASGVTELVGREEELEILLRRWSKAKSGEGQVVLLSGEPGIGKSRLTAALLERVAPEPHTRLRYFCSPQRTDSAFFPIISQMERTAGFTHADTGRVKLDKLDAVLALTSTSKQDAGLFAEMLSLSNDGRYPVPELTPQQHRQKTLEALHAQVETFARKNPVLMIFEDAHWADPTSLEAFGRAVDRIATVPVLGRTYILRRDYMTAGSVVDELVALADEKGAEWWKAVGTLMRGEVFGETGNASVAAQTITLGFTAQRSTGATFNIPTFSSCLARAYADLSRFDDAWRSIDEAMAAIETTKDKWWEAQVHRVAGEVALKSPAPNAAKAETHFERALAVARQQQAKSWELRAAMSLARLWRDQGKVREARELLAPVYGWFTEGFDTLDLKDAKALLEELTA
jgi:hypothetical protein